LDIIWIAEFAAAKWALPLDQYFKDNTGEYFPGMIQACTWQNKLVALPWFVDSGMLYYRKDLGMSAPSTWADLIASAKEATGSGKVKFGFLWQAKQAEVLVCDLVSFIGSNGGAILQADGKTVSIADAPAVEAVQLMYDLISKEQITPADVLSWDEEPSRRPFTGGEAAFLRNWSYVWKIAQSEAESKVVDKVAVEPLPHFPDKKSAACLGATNTGSTHPARNGTQQLNSFAGCPRRRPNCGSLPSLVSAPPELPCSTSRRLGQNNRLCNSSKTYSWEQFRGR
jgi:multiple sugar transport system substrate-binding protein